MKRSRFSEEQVTYALRQVESGTPVADVCRQLGVDECLNMHPFLALAHAQQQLDAWRVDYNEHRPHSSLGHLTPNEFVRQHGRGHRSEAASISCMCWLGRSGPEGRRISPRCVSGGAIDLR